MWVYEWILTSENTHKNSKDIEKEAEKWSRGESTELLFCLSSATDSWFDL